MIVKVLGAIDLAGMLAFFMLIFGVNVYTPFLLFCAGLLAIKGLFVLTGDILSFLDLYAAVALILSISFHLPAILLWIPAFLLLAKGLISFI